MFTELEGSNLLSAATDNNFSEPFTALNTRAKIYDAFRSLHALDVDNATSKEIFSQVLYYLAGISVFVTCNIITCISTCLCRRCPERRQFPKPRLPFVSARSKLRVTPAEETEGLTWSERHERYLKELNSAPPTLRSVLEFNTTFSNPQPCTAAHGDPKPRKDLKTNDLDEHARDIELFELSHRYTDLAPTTGRVAPV